MRTQERHPTAPLETPILIVGAGPVGAVLALELAHHQVPCVLVERATTPSRHPKMDYVSGRSMELLHRLGLADELRRRGVPAEYRANFLWSRGFDEPPVQIWDHPSVTELTDRFARVNDGSAPVQAYQRVQGSLLEQFVRDQARAHPLVDLWEGWSLTDLEQTPDGVSATVVEPATGTTRLVRARYLAGCDGANSSVRRLLAIPLGESGPKTRHCSVYFRSADPALRRHGRAFVTIAARGLTLVSRDERDTWTASLLLTGGAAEDAAVDADPMALVRERLGVDFAVEEVRSVARWDGTLAVADSYRNGSAFLVGDAAHVFYPTGGFGANTGLADAVDLGWKLSALVNGWGGAGLLESYERERRPVASFNAEMCANLMEVWRRFGRLVRAGASREHVAGFLGRESFQADNVGIHFGYRYGDSPVVWHEDGPAPEWQWRAIVPSTWPGGRAPSVRLADGTSVFDRLGPDYTLVDLSRAGTGEILAKEAGRRGVPVAYLRVDDPTARTAWDRDLVLVRPDHHVAWRGDAAPDDWGAVVDRVSGR
ncbi:FAD-dependent monooxygenase [Micromonospora pisi]|uniref:FAD-dependent monooxygenase n=1 Tax=Micromonospora pisi TaxID=589240 RepID=UPI001B86C30E|nr:FAD-dependent monooxygenase [Micromonospora pisi]